MKKIRILILLLAALLFTSACAITFQTSGDSKSAIDGGVYKTLNKGGNWTQETLVANITGEPYTFHKDNIISLALDPQDNKAVYAGTDSQGMLYSYDGGDSWTMAKELGKRSIKDIAVSSDDKCTIYIASDNKIFKSEDCSRSWENIYYDNETGVRINSLAVDPKNAEIIYAGTSRGEIIISSDSGRSWAALKRFSEEKSKLSVIKVIIDSRNPDNIWAGTDVNGVYKSGDKGKSWKSFEEEFMEINTKNSLQVSDIALAQNNGQTVIVATKAGLLRTYDAGGHWHAIELIPPSDKTAINAVEIHPIDSNLIYYTTNTSFVWSDDGGKAWTSKKLPGSRAGVVLKLDPGNPGVVYLGVKTVVKK